MKYLVEKGKADVNITDHEGQTPLHYSIKENVITYYLSLLALISKHAAVMKYLSNQIQLKQSDDQSKLWEDLENSRSRQYYIGVNHKCPKSFYPIFLPD